MQDSRPIEQIRKSFHNEWLLIEVDSIDKSKTEPLTGRLIDHAPTPEPLWQKAATIKGEPFIVYSDEWPKDLAACFLYGYISY